MEHPEPVSSILHEKSTIEIWQLPSSATVFEAIELMGVKNIGALLVIDGGQLVGIVSERDYTRKIILKNRSSKGTLIQQIMTAPVISVEGKINVDICLQLMTEKRIRHLPVVEPGGKVIGVVSIGDLVKRIITSQGAMIEHLESYISGGYPG